MAAVDACGQQMASASWCRLLWCSAPTLILTLTPTQPHLPGQSLQRGQCVRSATRASFPQSSPTRIHSPQPPHSPMLGISTPLFLSCSPSHTHASPSKRLPNTPQRGHTPVASACERKEKRREIINTHAKELGKTCLGGIDRNIRKEEEED